MSANPAPHDPAEQRDHAWEAIDYAIALFDKAEEYAQKHDYQQAEEFIERAEMVLREAQQARAPKADL